MRGFAIAGIGTGVGKTLVAALFVERLGAAYFKPVQAGGLEHTDTMVVRRLVTNKRARFLPEAYRLEAAMSPHAAAALEGRTLKRKRLQLPETDGPLVVEPAGGVRVPVAEGVLNTDLMEDWGLPVVVVANYYLGSINHSLLTVEALKARDLPLAGIVFSGEPNPESRSVILEVTGLPCLLDLPALPRPVSRKQIRLHAARIAF